MSTSTPNPDGYSSVLHVLSAYRSTAYAPQLRGDVAASLTTISASEGLIKSLDPDFDMLRGALPYFIRYRALGGPAAREPDADIANKNAQFAQRLQLDPA